MVVVAGVLIGIDLFFLYQYFSPLQVYHAQIDKLLLPYTTQINEHPLFQQAITYIQNPALLAGVSVFVVGLVWKYVTTKAENKINEVTTEANTAINQTQNVAQDLLNQKDTQIQALTQKIQQYESTDLGGQLLDAQNLLLEQKVEIERLKIQNTDLLRINAMKNVIVEEKVH